MSKHWQLVRVKRPWVPYWLCGLFCWDGLFKNWARRQPFRWLLTAAPDDITRARASR